MLEHCHKAWPEAGPQEGVLGAETLALGSQRPGFNGGQGQSIRTGKYWPRGTHRLQWETNGTGSTVPG